MDMPEIVWKAYIDCEEEEGEYERARDLYERLLVKMPSAHPKVWISYAHFEINVPDDEEEETEEEEEEKPASEAAKARARKIFERGIKYMKDKDDALHKEYVCFPYPSIPTFPIPILIQPQQRVSLLNAYLIFERQHGTPEDIEKVQKQMPRKTKRRRTITGE